MARPFVLYSYAGCSTCRDAVKWLGQHALSFDERPIYTEPPPVTELRRMLAHYDGDVRRLFNTSGLEYRALGLKTKLPALSPAEALALLSSNGKLVKRPFLLGEKVGVVGFKPAEWAERLLGAPR